MAIRRETFYFNRALNTSPGQAESVLLTRCPAYLIVTSCEDDDGFIEEAEREASGRNFFGGADFRARAPDAGRRAGADGQ